MSPGEASLRRVIGSAHGKAVIASFYRRLEEVAARDERGATLALKFQERGELLSRAAFEVERDIEQMPTVRRQGRSQRERDIAVHRWAASLFGVLIRWVDEGGSTRAKAAVAAARAAKDRNKAIADSAEELLKLLERHSYAMVTDFELGVPHTSHAVALPLLRRDLHRLVLIASGKRREWRKAREVEIRENNGMPLPEPIRPLSHGAQGFISQVDYALPFLASSDAVIDLWHFVSGEVIGESTVRAARSRLARTNLE